MRRNRKQLGILVLGLLALTLMAAPADAGRLDPWKVVKSWYQTRFGTVELAPRASEAAPAATSTTWVTLAPDAGSSSGGGGFMPDAQPPFPESNCEDGGCAPHHVCCPDGTCKRNASQCVGY